MLTVVKVNNKNIGTMLYCIYFEHTQQINLIFLLSNLNMYLLVGHKTKSTKQLKCILNNRAVSLKHVAKCSMSK